MLFSKKKYSVGSESWQIKCKYPYEDELILKKKIHDSQQFISTHEQIQLRENLARRVDMFSIFRDLQSFSTFNNSISVRHVLNK